MPKKYTPQKLKMLITIVNSGKGNFYHNLIEDYGVNMQLLLNGKGTMPKNVNNLFGAINKGRDVIFSFVTEDKVKPLLKFLDDKFESVRDGAGISFSVPMSSVIGVNVYQFLTDNRKKREV